MLTLFPLSDKNEIAEIYSNKNLNYTDNSGCLLCKEGETVLGFCLYEFTKEKITVNYIEPQADIALADGILRSTLHVAAENSVMNAFYGENLAELCRKLGFIKNAEENRLDIDKLFKSCQGCN